MCSNNDIGRLGARYVTNRSLDAMSTIRINRLLRGPMSVATPRPNARVATPSGRATPGPAVWVARAFLVAIAVFLLWTRFVRLNTSVWNDEAYSVMTFIDRGPMAMFTGYYDLNNHLLSAS
jgi:hypothetical protein